MLDRLFRIVRNESCIACLVLALLLIACFLPAVIGKKTLMTSVWDAASIMNYGAYDSPRAPLRYARMNDAGACAWQTEPWLKILSHQFKEELNIPLWNPHSGFGTPFAATMQPQPFFPLTTLLALHPTPYTYNLYILARLLVAGVFMFLFVHLFLPFFASLFSAVAFMLTGYLVIHLNISHLSVEILLPAVFWAFERVLRQKSFGVLAQAAVVVMLSIIGGMPESTFLILSFGYVYFIVRALFDIELCKEKILHFRNFVLVNIFGFALGAFLLLPFVELMSIGHDVHQPVNFEGYAEGVSNHRSGLIYDSDPRNIIGYLVPMLFGPITNSIFSKLQGGPQGWTGIFGYFGLLPVLFAVYALGGHVPRSRKSLRQPLVQLTLFFGLALLFMLLKRYGSPLVQWIGSLPLFNMVVYPKYQEPLLAFSCAVLAGIGFARLMEGKIKPPFVFLGVTCVLGTTLGLSFWSLRRVLQSGEYSWVFFLYLFLATLLLFIFSIAYSLFFKEGNGFSGRFKCVMLALLAVEMSLNFLVPSFYLLHKLPPLKGGPFNGAPYLRFLNDVDTDRARVFARDALLYPNWAGVFDLDDVRALDGMYYRRYIRFIRNFLLMPGCENRHSGDLADRFTGDDPLNPYEFKSDRERRFLELSSVRYLVTLRNFGDKPNLIDDIFSQHKNEGIWGFGPSSTVMEGRAIPILFHHPPSRRIAYRITIDQEEPVLSFCVLIRPEAHDFTDGVRFFLEVRHDDVVEELFSETLIPKTRPVDRKAHYGNIDLSKYAGREVEILFSTDVVPGGSNSSAWAGWGDIRFTSSLQEEPEPGLFKKVYGKEVQIYEVPQVLPRASIYYGIEMLDNEKDILNRLKDPSFDIWGSALVWGGTLSTSDRKYLEELGSGHGRKAVPARIVSYQSQRVVIEASAEGPSLLMLNDANYPGWKAYVNGRQEPIFNVDYLFRGVVLPGGTSTVEFVYRPFTFMAGAIVSILAVIAGLAIFVSQRRRTKKLPD